MTTLINFNLNKKTGVIFFPEKKIVRKFSILKKNNKFIKNEFDGFNWYYNRIKKKKYFKKKIILKKNNNFIDTSLIKGKNIKYWNSIKVNKEFICAAIKHYEKIWPQTIKTYYHGDLTIENMIFIKNKEPIFIDWEKSRRNELWGLDICYLLISSVALPNLVKNKKMTNEEKSIFKNFWVNFFHNKNFKYQTNPFNFFKTNKILDSNNFINKISQSMKKEILELINEK